MGEQRKLTTIVATDVVGYSRLAAADEERTVARLRALRGDLIDPAIVAHHGRVVKRTGDGTLMEFRSVVDAVRCAIEVQNGMVERNAGLPPERQILFRVGIHLGDVIEEADGDLMGDGVNIAARLESICAPGAICISEDAYRQVRSRLDLAVSDLGDKELKNIPEPVHVYALEVGKPIQAHVVTPAQAGVQRADAGKAASLDSGFRRSGQKKLIPIVAGIVALIVVAAAAAWYFLAGPGGKITVANAPAHLSIVVLPFANLSNDPKQDYFADGITDNLTTDLSRIRNSFVIARNTAFTYKGKPTDAKEIGKELGVRYVLEGSVARDGNRVRVNAQLIDAESGAHLWADRFEEDLADLFKLQDDVVARLANTLGYELTRAEAARGAHAANPDAIDMVMQGWALANQHTGNKEIIARAGKFFSEALKLDPYNDAALAGLAYVGLANFAFGLGNGNVDYDMAILAPADKAIALNPYNVGAYATKSTYLFLTKRGQEAFTAADAGLAANPSSAELFFARSGAENALGRFAQSKTDILHAMRLSPRDLDLGRWHMSLGQSEMGLGHYDAAIEEERRAIEIGYRNFIPYVNLAAAYALAGRQTEAQAALSEARRLNPKLTVKWWIEHGPTISILFEGARKAGLPEDEPSKHLSIVVLPFENLSGDPKQDYFADGITDNLTTDLSRIRNSFVIARNTAFTYKGKPTDAKEIGKELGVRYVLEGSVARDGNRVRVNAQLIDAESGAHLWADRFEEDLADLFKLQDDVVARLANTLGYELVKAEADKAAHSANPDAIDLTMQGWASMNAQIGRDKTRYDHLRELFERALAVDPDNADALAGEARVYEQEFAYGLGNVGSDYETKVISLSDRAIALNPNVVWAYYVKSNYLFLSRRAKESLQTADTGLTINPNFAPLYMARRGAEISLGQFKQAADDVRQAMRLSPRDPELALWHMQLGAVQFGLGDFDAVIDEENKAIDGGFREFQPFSYLAAVFALTGRQEEAKAALAKAQSLNPQLASMKWLFSHSPYMPRYFDGMRKAGLPEDEPTPPPKHLSIVVLPFENLSGDPKQDYFADGITDNLTTDLSRIRNSFVIARNTAFTYKGKSVDAKEIGKELGVRYVLEGSVARDGNRVRVNAQLIDAESGAHLWADRFEEDLADLFKLQDDVVARLANTLGYELVKAEAAKSAHSANPDSLDLYFQGMAWLYRGLTPKDSAKAQDFFGRALVLDPGDIDAMLGIASVDVRLAVTYVADDRTARLASAEAKLTKILSLAPDNANAHVLLGAVEIASNRAAEAITELQRALMLNPNLASAHADLGFAKYNLGHAEESETHVREALHLSPRDTEAYSWMLVAGVAKVFLGADAEAVAWMRRSIEGNPNFGTSHFVLAAALANLGRLDEARAAAKSGLALDPKFTIHRYIANPSSDNPTYLTQRERLIDGWRKAGMPEQ